MDSVDPGALLAAMSSGAAPQTAASGNIDAQILGLLKQTASPASSPASTQNARAAQSAYDAAQKNGATLKVGLPGVGYKDTGIPIPNWLDQAMVGGGGMLEKQFAGLTGHPMDPMAAAVNQQAQGTTTGRLGATGTGILESVPLGMGVGGVLGRLGATGARLAANPVSLGAAQGAAQGALMADPGQRLEGGLLGAATGAAFPLAGKGLGKLATGLARSPDAQTLINQGITLPPGMLNPHGPASALEQAGTHIPFIGSRIGNARAAVPAQVTERMVQDAAAPGASVPHGLGINDAVSELKDGFDNAYATTLGTPGKGYPVKPVIMRTSGPDIPLTDALSTVAAKARGGMTAPQRAQLGQTLQDHLAAAIQQSGGQMEATDLQGLRSVFRDASRDISPIDNASRAQREFWDDAQAKVTDALKSQLPPKVSAQLDNIDQQYGKFATVRNLAVSVKDRTPTMNDWSSAIKQSTPPNVYAAGGGWNRDLIQAAAKTVKPTVAHTGALGAGTVAPIVAAASAGVEGLMHPGVLMAHPLVAGGTAGLLGSLYGAYSKAGMRALAGQTGAQKAVAGLLQSVNPALRKGLSLGTRATLLQGLLGGPAAGLLQAPPQ